ncbi:Peptidoglycan/LPS O-acetylase OafA/YrhL, contains acyltransferase and SGNH-hydrolase domains [Rhizobiales bacterium GAS191]|nr:Peptidoglycan/LPS O-acetylase OafA/YrhL, contains acyltransferase and SGNH-hydrolase domains [Rhizobiales bacterium GAS191]
MHSLDALNRDRSAASPGLPGSSGLRRIGDIEVLRGIAVLFVIVHHAHGNLITWPIAPFDKLFHYLDFWPGVDLFFAISGFVIARSLLPKLSSCASDMAFFRECLAFWIRRAWRLLPSAWLWLAIMLVASAAFNRSGVFGSFHVNFAATIAGVLDVANFRFADTFMRSEYGASFVYWSLSLEEQFYLLLPVAAFLFRGFLPLPIPLGLMVLLQIISDRTPLLMVLRTDAILLGVLIAIWSRHASYRLAEPGGLARSRVARAATLILLLGSIAALACDDLHVVSARVGLIALLSAALVLIASYNRDYLWRDGTGKRVMLWIGSRSYGLYLIHIPAFFFTREIWLRLHAAGALPGPEDIWPICLTAGLILVAASELNYRLVEAPLRAHGARLAEGFRLAAPA